MNPILRIIIIAAIFWGINAFLGMIQIKDFNKNYIELKRKSRVLIGRKRGYFQAGTVVLLAIDGENNITEARKMQGVSILARVKPFEGLQGINIKELENENILKKFNKLTRQAINNAHANFYAFYKEKEPQKEAAVI